MSVLDLSSAAIAELGASVAPPGVDDDPDRRRDRVALAAWSCIAEPGDGIAGRLIELLGPTPALAAAAEDAEAVLYALPSSADPMPTLAELRAALGRWAPRLDAAAVTRALRQANRFAARFVIPGDPVWPSGLDDLGDHRPVGLWLRGDAEVLGGVSGASIALVGARAASGYGEHVAIEAASGLVDRGYTVVSGAAYGIDGVAHRSALAGEGPTVAVLAGGLDRFYPSGHEALLSRIVERGAVVAEVPFGAAPSRWRFLQRNRLIAAMSQATVVVEAGWRSGSLNTAGHASSLGRPLGAVPGPVTSTTSAGCHRLLREYDATCVTSAEEMAELAPVTAPRRDPARAPAATAVASSDRRDPESIGIRVLDALSTRTPRSPERIAREAGLAIDRVRSELGLLALDGAVGDRGEGWVKLTRR